MGANRGGGRGWGGVTFLWDVVYCCIFPPGFWCWAPQTLVKIVIFSVFYAKKLKKGWGWGGWGVWVGGECGWVGAGWGRGVF